MPYKEKQIEKLYYSISEVAAELNVSASLLRFWESEFPNLNPKKNKKGNRLYTKEDIEELKVIYHLVKEKGYKLAGAKEIISKEQHKVADNVAIVKQLEEVRDFLVELKKSLG